MHRIAAYAPSQATSLGIKPWLLAGAAVLIVVQIVVFWQVANGQVKAAALRDSRQTEQWLALGACVELHSNTARSACSADVLAANDAPDAQRSSREIASNADLVMPGNDMIDRMSGSITPASFLATQ
jgi:hypothetical protein